MKKLVCFDFDGVLVRLKEVHYLALNKALELVDHKYVISEEEHTSTYDGLSTNVKLEMLNKSKGLPQIYFDEVFENKQKFTVEFMSKLLTKDYNLHNILHRLKKENYTIFVTSNAIRNTISLGLKLIDVNDLVDRIISNEDVILNKPHPQIYLYAMYLAGTTPDNTVIVEDSKHGREAAIRSGANVLGIDFPEDLSYEKIKKCFTESSSVKWSCKYDTNVLIPCAGAGSRFQAAGFKLPKPLIDVNGQPMIKVVVDNLNIDAHYIFLVQKEHCEKFYIDKQLKLISPNCDVVVVDGLTEGAACTTLLAKELINNDKHLLIANSDQFMDWDSCSFMYESTSSNLDGSILVFHANHPKWSYVKSDRNRIVSEVAEKKVISTQANCGIYYFNKGSDYVKYAERMIAKNIRTNNEFYIAPVYNEFIEDGKKIKAIYCDAMYGLGTPEDLAEYLKYV